MNECTTEDAQDCVWDAQKQGNGEGQSFVDVAGEATPYDYTDVVASDGFIVDCGSSTTTHWFEQVVMGFKDNEDGTVTSVDLGYVPEYYEDVIPSTEAEIQGRCELPEQITTDAPVLEEIPVVETSTLVATDMHSELAETGTGSMLVVAVVAVVLLGVGVVLMSNGLKRSPKHA